jgi:hypothetical protein
MAKFLLPMLPCLFRGTKLPNVLLCLLPFLKYFLDLGLRLSLKRDATEELCPFMTTIIKGSFTIIFCHLVHRRVAKPESVHLRDAGNGGGPLPLLLVSSHSLLRHRLLAHHTKPTKKPFTNLHNSMQQANSAAA